MTRIVDSSPAIEEVETEEIESFLAQFEDARLDDTDWIDAEFDAIIAANFDAEPPEIPGPPAGLPARWHRPGGPPRGQVSHKRLASAVMAGDHHRRQRSPPSP